MISTTLYVLIAYACINVPKAIEKARMEKQWEKVKMEKDKKDSSKS